MTKLREVSDICRDFVGLNPAQDLIPVRPTQHYSMGGIRVNKDGEAYGLRGLFAVGEAACWDMHGFNRLGGNSLAETLVAGRLVGRRVAVFAASEGLELNTEMALGFVTQSERRASAWLQRSGEGPTVYQIRDRMAETMMGKVGIFRHGDELSDARATLLDLLEQVRRAVLRCKAPGMNPELTFALRLEGMLRLALVTTVGALARCESRGAHYRSDYPLRNDADWLKRTLARWPVGAAEPTLSYEPAGLIDLPPGHRGYGSGERIAMQQSTEEYNAAALHAQSAAGRPETIERFGSRLRWGAWREPNLKPGTTGEMGSE